MSVLGLVMHPLVVAAELISGENEAHDTPAENVNCPIIQRLKGGLEPKRIVMFEFADTAAFKRWHNSPKYQKILPGRLDNSTGLAFIVEGVA
jgi:hypothetical protein